MTKVSTRSVEPSGATRPSPKKLKTSRRIQEEAIRLFLEQGFEATTVEQVATAAGVSHMTVFRHFPTKEALVLQDEFDPVIADAIRSRPSTEPALESLRLAIVASVSRIPDRQVELAQQRTRLIMTTPALMAKLWANMIDTNAMLAQALKDRGGVPDDADLEVITAIASGIFATTMIQWMRSGATTPIADLVNHAFTVGQHEFSDTANT